MRYEGALEKLRARGLKVNPERFLSEFNRMSRIGWVEGYGMNRLALSENHVAVRMDLMEQLKALGAKVKVDEAGNIIAELGEQGEAVAMGSHLDSVPGGGRFDGAYGVIAGLEVLRTIKESNVRLRHRLVLIDFNNEEGSRWSPPLLGSGLSCGVYTRDFVYSRVDRNGVRFEDALRNTGFMGSPENNISRNPPRFYVELHIEQGPELYSKGYDIGIPQGIVGIRVVELAFRGSQDHASSPLWARRDALTGLVIVKSRLEEYALERVDKLRVTIGRVNVEPNVANVVPGEVRFTVDIRSYDLNIIDETVKYIVENGEDIARRRGLDFEHRDLWYIERTLFDTQVVKTIEEACEELEFKCLKMWSWAGHDAQNMARLSRTGMIFIPSVNGRSHSKDEYSRDEDLVKGLLVLLNVVLALDSS